MIQDLFGSLINELAGILKTQLTPDKNNSCKLKFKSGVMVQIDFDAGHDRLLIVSSLGNPAPGRYREDIFREALKANGLPPPKYGIFAYSKKQEALVLYGSLSIKELSGQKLADFLIPFSQRAELWNTTITRGEIPSFTGTEITFGKTAGAGMFGL